MLLNAGRRQRQLCIRDRLTSAVIARKIQDVIENFEPRARLVSVDARPNLARNAYEVTISFYVRNIPGELVQLNTLLERSR